VSNQEIVGYDTAVIGGTMALTSFQRDFNMASVAKSQRDTIQGNIVSTFQVSIIEHRTSFQRLIFLGWLLLRRTVRFSIRREDRS
jgi:hypothetical protein